jgi:hypothetical protein
MGKYGLGRPTIVFTNKTLNKEMVPLQLVSGYWRLAN